MRGLINSEISKNDLLSFMDRSDVEYSIPRENYDSIFITPDTATKIIYHYNKKILEELYGDSFPNIQEALANSITPSLIYNNGWRLAITTDGIVNGILRNFGCYYRVKDFSAEYSGNSDANTKKLIRELGEVKNRMYMLDDYRLRDSLSNYVLKSFNYSKKTADFMRDEICDFIDTTKYLLVDKEFNDIKEFDVGINLENRYRPKNLLYTLSVSSLLKLIDFKDSDYSLLPRTYYERVSRVGTSPWPKGVIFNKKRYFAYDDYNKLYDKVYNFDRNLLGMSKQEKEVLLSNFVFLPPGKISSEPVTSSGHRTLQMSKEELTALKDKVDFFEKTNYRYKLEGVDLLDGYMGFVYDNDRIIFEKFYRDKERSKPARDEAIYTMPVDKLLLSLSNKQDIIKYMKDNPESEVTRIVHRGYSYKNKVIDIICSPNVSTESFDSIKDRMIKSGKMLIKK